jgi:mono/diheme cytochrome c family protein
MHASSALLVGRVEGRLFAFVTDEDEHALFAVDVARRAIAAHLSLPARPGHVIAHGGSLAVALRDTDEVMLVDVMMRDPQEGIAALRPGARLQVAQDPLAMSSVGGQLYVASAASATLSILSGDAASDRPPARRVALPRDARAVLGAVSLPGGKPFEAIVAHATGSGLSLIDDAPQASRLSLDLGEICTVVAIDECMTARTIPSMQSYGMAVVRGRLLVPSVSSLTDGPLPVVHEKPLGHRPQLASGGVAELVVPSSQGGYGGGNISLPINFRIDVLRAGTKPGQLAFERADRFGVHDCTLPRALVPSPDGDQLWMACLGSGTQGKVWRHEVREERGRLALRARDRVELPFVSALGFDVTSGDVLAYSPFDRRLSILPASIFRPSDKPSAAPASDAQIELPHISPELQPSSDVAAGRRLFHTTDARISRGKKACASCHPDGGDDGLAWDTPMGRRRTLALAGRLPSEGFGWEGRHKTLEEHISRTLRENLGGKGLSPDELTQLVSYLRAMRAPASRPPVDAARRGAALFAGAAGCATCHLPSEAFADGLVHDVGFGPVRTPSLLGAASRPRFFHGGQHTSLDAALRATHGKMGQPLALVADDQAALRAYLDTL